MQALFCMEMENEGATISLLHADFLKFCPNYMLEKYLGSLVLNFRNRANIRDVPYLPLRLGCELGLGLE